MSKFSLYVAAIFMLSSAFASEHQEPRQAGTRAMDQAEWMKIQEERAAEEQKQPSKEKFVAKRGALASPQASTGINFTSHTGAFHSPLAISIFGDSIELEDGSVWSVSPSDGYKALNWLTSDLLVITPNHDWFSSHLFKMTNQATGISVKCNLSLMPVYNGLYTHWIRAINYYTQEIALEDGSIWQVSGLDSSTFSQWLLNDTVIIGVNDGFLSGSKENILINAETLGYVRAHCVF